MFKFSVLCALVYASVVTGVPAPLPQNDVPPSSMASTSLAQIPTSASVSITSTPILSTLPPAQSTATGTQPASVSVPFSAAPEWETVAPIDSFANAPVWDQNANVDPEAINDHLGASIISPENVPLDQMNPDFIAPPTTDSGSVYVRSLPILYQLVN